LQSVRFGYDGTPSFAESVAGDGEALEDNRGDGTLFRYVALPSGVVPAYLPQSHGALVKPSEGLEFAVAAATERSLGAFQAGDRRRHPHPRSRRRRARVGTCSPLRVAHCDYLNVKMIETH
jgi:hypothetical protein